MTALAPPQKALSPEQLAALIEAIREQSPWRDTAGIAMYLGVDVKKIHRLTAPNVQEPARIPYHRLTPGGRKMFNIKEVDKWLRRQ